MTRRHLIEAAAVVFARNGFHGSSLDEVAATAGFTKGTVYSNFKSKDELFLALLDDRMESQAVQVLEALDTIGGMEPDGEEQLRRMREVIERTWDEEWSALYLEFVLYARRNPQARAKLSERMKHQHELARHMFAREYERVGGQPLFPLDLVTMISLAVFEGLSIARLVDESAVTPETVSDTLTFLFATVGIDSLGS